MSSGRCARRSARIVREEIQPRVREIDENCEYPRDLYAVMAERDLLGLGFPREYGGRCDSEVSWCAYVEELAKVSGTVSLMAAYVKLVSLPLLLAGSEEQKQRVLPGAAGGRDARLVRAVGAQRRLGPRRAGDARGAPRRRAGCSTAPSASSATPGSATSTSCSPARATPAQGRQRVPRRRARRRRLLGAAAHDGDAGLAARRAALRGRRDPGREPDRPRGRRLPDRDGDFDRSRPTVAAQAVGLGQGAIDLAVDYATRRHAFGEPLLAHQGIQFKLADMEADVAAARALTFQAATAIDEDDPRLTKLAAMAKMKASDASNTYS